MVGIVFLFIMTVALGGLLDCYIEGLNHQDSSRTAKVHRGTDPIVH